MKLKLRDLAATREIDVSRFESGIPALDFQVRRAYLVVLGGMNEGMQIRLEPGSMVLGRGIRCDVRLQDDGLSRRHAEIVYLKSEERVIVRDLKSTNGVYFRGERVEKAELKNGDKILLGCRVFMKVVYQDEFDFHCQEALFNSSIRDPLTKCYNRRYFLKQMSEDVSFSRRHHFPLTLLLFDIDFFKNVNDAHGHQTGDRVLRVIVDTAVKKVRHEDLVARFGGEEFAILAKGTEIEGARRLGERVRECIAAQSIETVDGSGKSISVTISVGIATTHRDAVVDSVKIISEADKNLYYAKATGRNRVIASEIAAGERKRWRINQADVNKNH